ncbi:hypothetical protein ACJIZ3_019431 [Penstemon smallii]|uniref:Cytochrome b561 domain-containing protein n=1 Tax=Penstemon smallii TaxID=265156 RepID=A0ABD3T160_9LAMI
MAPKTSSSYGLSAFPVTIFAHLVAIAVTTLVLVWLLHFRGGFAFKSDDKAKIFNLHPLLMVLGFVLISGEAIMAYKTAPSTRKSQKLFHLILHLIALVAGIIGIYSVFKFHNELGIPNIGYSPFSPSCILVQNNRHGRGLARGMQCLAR